MQSLKIRSCFLRVCCLRAFKGQLSTEASSASNAQKRKKRGSLSSTLFSPALDPSQLKEISSIVAVNVRIDFISWAKICLNSNQLTDWNIYHVPRGLVKSDPITIHQMMLNVYHKLPAADLYIMDQAKKGSSSNPASSVAFVVKLQFLSILITMINFQKDCPVEVPEDNENLTPKSKVVFLRPFLAMQLFGLLVGKECIAVEPTIVKIFRNELEDHYTPIEISPEIQRNFDIGTTPSSRDNMGMALLMGLTFKELIIHKNPRSFKVLLKNYDAE